MTAIENSSYVTNLHLKIQGKRALLRDTNINYIIIIYTFFYFIWGVGKIHIFKIIRWIYLKKKIELSKNKWTMYDYRYVFTSMLYDFSLISGSCNPYGMYLGFFQSCRQLCIVYLHVLCQKRPFFYPVSYKRERLQG